MEDVEARWDSLGVCLGIECRGIMCCLGKKLKIEMILIDT